MSAGNNFARYVETVCENLGISFFQLAADLDRNPSQLWHELSSAETARAKTLDEIANHLDVSLDALLTQRIDVPYVLALNETSSLPEKYQVGAASQIRTTLPVLHFVRSRWGNAAYKSILRTIGVSEKAFAKPDSKVSLKLLTDLLDLLHRRGLSEHDFFAMGCAVTEVPANRVILSEYEKLKTHRQVYEHLVGSVARHYEKNFFYRTERSESDRIVVEVTPRPEVQEAFQSYCIDSRWVSFYRLGVAAAHPTSAGLRPALVRELRNMHDGSDRFAFELSW